eukprot:6461111-Karenia_brevis.AAC.1
MVPILGSLTRTGCMLCCSGHGLDLFKGHCSTFTPHSASVCALAGGVFVLPYGNSKRQANSLDAVA